ncbi:glycerophosphodiester phosphodiesterase 1-like [Oscarella lobularis]|uniref:glycerophosphodiester phosphodiesterase 1-like n=1 Tax=Oscarella lobularis TaxID=121494 RepID=UPI0033137986
MILLVCLLSALFFLFFFCFFLSPKKQPRDVVTTILGSTSGVIAHRGENVDAPENTLAAFRLARKNGAVAVEIDVSFTKDGHAVLMHDDTVDRTTDGHGRLDELTLDELKTLNAAHGHRLESEFDGVRVPTLDEAIEECLHLGLKIIFDVKGNAAQSVPVLVAAYKKYDLYGKAFVASFNSYVLYKLRRADPEILIGLTSRQWYWSYKADDCLVARHNNAVVTRLLCLGDIMRVWCINTWLLQFLGSSLYVIVRSQIYPELVKHWKIRGVHLVAWTVNDPLEKRYFEEVLNIFFMTDSTRN